MKLFVYSINETLHEGPSDVVVLPTESGEISILPKHIPLLTSLKKGTISWKTAGQKKELGVEKGFAFINGEAVVALVS